MVSVFWLIRNYEIKSDRKKFFPKQTPNELFEKNFLLYMDNCSYRTEVCDCDDGVLDKSKIGLRLIENSSNSLKSCVVWHYNNQRMRILCWMMSTCARHSPSELRLTYYEKWQIWAFFPRVMISSFLLNTTEMKEWICTP